MSLTLKPYPEYKDSELPWLGKIPAGWRLLKTKYLFAERSQKGFPDEPLLAATQTKGVIPKSLYENRTVVAMKDLHLLKLVEKGDYVISLRSFEGGIEVAHYRGIISPAYTVLKPTSRVQQDYANSLFKSRTFIDSLPLYITGIREGQNIDYGRLSRAQLPVPPETDQLAIGRFLRVKMSHVNKLIRAKRRMIELLNDQKQAIIQRAVTRGLDSNVRFKPSGFSWIGNVPEHWQVGALRRFWNVIDCKHLTVPFAEEGIPLASVVEAQSFDLSLSFSKKTSREWYEKLIEGGRKPKRGDLIYCRNTSVGACAYVGTDAIFAMGQDVCVITSDAQNQRYLSYFFHSHAMDQQLSRLMVGSTFKRINISQILGFTVPVPTRPEQDAIAEYLDGRCSGIESAIGKALSEIDLLREYRIRLIADVVTGKLDVRGVELPELEGAGEIEPLIDVADEELEDSEELVATEESPDAD